VADPDRVIRLFEREQLAVAPARRLDRELQVLGALGSLDRAVRVRIGDLVDICRRQGASWSEIGKQLGISKQAAQERFGSTARPTA
jgi:ABC-type antimicrobial peptide transport system ATPase subunit